MKSYVEFLWAPPVVVNCEALEASYPGPDGLIVRFQSGRSIVLPQHSRNSLYEEQVFSKDVFLAFEASDAEVLTRCVEHIEFTDRGVVIQLVSGAMITLQNETEESVRKALEADA